MNNYNDKQPQSPFKKKYSSWRNIISNRSDSTIDDTDISASGTAGLATIGVGLISFLTLIIFYLFQIGEAPNILVLADKILALLTIGASLLGVRKISSVISQKKVDGSTIEEMMKFMEEVDKERQLQMEKMREEYERRMNDPRYNPVYPPNTNIPNTPYPPYNTNPMYPYKPYGGSKQGEQSENEIEDNEERNKPSGLKTVGTNSEMTYKDEEVNEDF